MGLLNSTGPSAIFFRVSKVVIFSFEGKARRLISHIFEKVKKRLSPALGNVDPSAPIASVCVMMGLVAAIQHCYVYFIRWISGETMRCAPVVKAPAGHGPVCEAGIPDAACHAASAATHHPRGFVPVWEFEDFKDPEFCANENVARGAINAHTLFSFSHILGMFEVSDTAPARAVLAFIDASFSPTGQTFYT